MSGADRLARFLRQCLLLLAAGLMALALYVSLGRQLVPWVAEFRGELAQRAETLLQLPVRIGRLQGDWQAFSPHLLIQDLVIGEGSGAIRLEQARVVVDVFESLWQRQLRLYAVELEGLQLALEQRDDGRWQVRGLRLPEGRPPPDIGRLLDLAQRLPRLTLNNGQLTLQPHGLASRTLRFVDLALQGGGPRMQLEGRALLADGQPLALSLDARVRPEAWREATLDAYLSLPQRDWADWLPPGLGGDLQLQRLQGGGELWLRWGERRLQRAVARLHAAEVVLARAGEAPVAVQQAGLTAYFEQDEAGPRLLLDNLAFSQGDLRWGEVRIGVRGRKDAQGGIAWQASAGHLDIGPLVPLVKALAPLPPAVVPLLADLAPHGRLRNLSLVYRPAAVSGERLSYSANLEGVGFSEHHWVPAAEGIAGSIRGDLAGGELRLDAPEASLHLARLFPRAWRYEHVRGRLLWQLDEREVTLRAPYLQLRGDEGQLAGDFLIRLRRDPAAEDYMDLRIGLREGDAAFTERYLPTRSPALNPALAEWLQGAVKGGHIEQGLFLYQGALNAGAPAEARRLSLYFRLNDATLAYRPGWPALREAAGELWVEGGATRVRLERARMLDSRLHEVTASVARGEGDQPPRLRLQGQVDGDLGDGLRLLQEAPMGTAELFAGWEAQGAATARLELDLPLVAGTQPALQVDITTQSARLLTARPALELQQLAGEFRYDSATGFSARRLQAEALGHRLRGRALAIGEAGRPATRIEVQGRVGLDALTRWLEFAQPLPARGELPYQLALTLAGDGSRLTIDSSLQGLAIELPAPYGKPAPLRRDTSLALDLGAGEARGYHLQYADLASLAFTGHLPDWQAGRGELRLGGARARLPDTPSLRLRGQMPRLALAEWRAVLAALQPTATGAGGANWQPPAWLQGAQLSVGRFEGLGLALDDLDLRMRRQAEGWQLTFDSPRLAGRLNRPSDLAAPLALDLRHLRLPPPAGEEAAAGADPLQAFDPADLPSMDVRVDGLWLGEERLGSLSARLRPTTGGVQATALDLQLRGLAIDGQLTWRQGASHYQGRVQGGDIADVLAVWGFARSVTSERFALQADLEWPGSPLAFGFRRLSGRLEPRLEQGQFVELDGGAQALRVFGLLNFNAIGRRLRLDFSDLLGRGLSYDRVQGVLQARDGVYRTREPLTLDGPSSDLQLDGTLDLVSDRIDAKLLVTLPVTNNLPLAAIIAGAPAIGGALWIADKLLGDRVARFATVQYDIEGPWQSPVITFDKPFEKPEESR